MFEFGMGGSTGIASRLEGVDITSVDTDPRFVSSLRDARLGPRAKLWWVNVGPVRNWGFPNETFASACRDTMYGNYFKSYAALRAPNTDTIFIDGRFRVLSVPAVLATGDRPQTFLVHDFVKRPHYADMALLLDQVECGAHLCVFRPKPNLTPEMIEEVRKKHELDVSR